MSNKKVSSLVRWAAVAARICLALLFIVGGLQKFPDGYPPVVSFPEPNPVGAYFKAMIDTGLYWKFIGVGEILAAVLLLIPRTATLGALVLLPIVVNVWMLTLSLYPHFGNTLYLNTIALLLNLFLLARDYPKLRFILWRHPPRVMPEGDA